MIEIAENMGITLLLTPSSGYEWINDFSDALDELDVILPWKIKQVEGPLINNVVAITLEVNTYCYRAGTHIIAAALAIHTEILVQSQ